MTGDTKHGGMMPKVKWRIKEKRINRMVSHYNNNSTEEKGN